MHPRIVTFASVSMIDALSPHAFARNGPPVVRFGEIFDAGRGDAVSRPESLVGWTELARHKNISKNSCLRRTLDHACVLFVQHPSKNGRTRTVLRRSFVACAGVLGNCLGATEGGIPRSSRYRW